MKKIWLLMLAVVFCVAMPLCVSASEGETRDFSFENGLASDLKALGLFSGVSENDFDLERAPSRLEVLVMLIRVLGEEKDALEGDFEHPFTDVPEWADKYVGYAYENGLTNGVSPTKFGSGDASAATYLTFMLRALGYSDADGDFKWDDPYNFAYLTGLLPSCVDTENFLRADIVTISYAALYIELKDTTTLLYEKLIEKGAFDADTFGKNYKTAKITDKENENKTALAAEDVYSLCSSAVFLIEVKDEKGKAYALGSGFFIAESGIAVTNYHVIESANSATITLAGSGAKYDVSGVYYYSMFHDVAVIQVDGSGFDCIKVNPFPVKGASTVYAIGSPRGLENTISQGIISNVRRVLGEETYIQSTAAISNGSSGGVLLNSYGEAIGITSAGFDDGQNLNFARPISYIAPAKLDKAEPLSEINWNSAEYSLDEEEYTLAAGEKLTLEFDVKFYTLESDIPNFKAESDNPDVCVAESGFGDTYVNLVAVAPGTANITISDDTTDDSITFKVTVTEGENLVAPFIVYFTRVDEIGLNKGATNTLLIDTVSVGVEEGGKWKVTSKNTAVAKVLAVRENDGFVEVDVKAIKNGSTTLSIKYGGYDEYILPVTVGEQFYIAFDALKDYAITSGEFHDDEDNTKDYYEGEGRTYADGDVVNVLYYPETDTVALRVSSETEGVGVVDLLLTRESATEGKKIEIEMDIAIVSLYARGEIKNVSSFGDGKNDVVDIAEISILGEQNDEYKKEYGEAVAAVAVSLLYEFDMWFIYILPEIDATDLGFVAIDYDAYLLLDN